METTVDWLWRDLIDCVTQRTSNITSKIMYTGILSDVGNDKNKALRETCDDLREIISKLYDRVLEIKTQSFFIEKTKNNMEE